MTPNEIQTLFTRSDGTYAFARWGRAIAPVVFGVEDATLATVKGAFQAVATLAGHEITDTDPELGANCMMFFFRDWEELRAVPDLDKLVPNLADLLDKLIESGANQYRMFMFDDDGAIKAAFVFLRMDEALSAMAADTLALAQVAQTFLVWSDAAFAETSPLAILPDTGATILRPEIGAVIRHAYDPVMPVAANEPSHALRLAARIQQEGG